eukprot:jgi/Bigna1/80735/fgenesh1_pg.73_\
MGASQGGGGVASEQTPLNEILTVRYNGMQIRLTSDNKDRWTAKDIVRVSVGLVSALLSMPCLGFPALMPIMRSERVFESYCYGNDCRIQAAWISSTALLALWISYIGIYTWRILEDSAFGTAGIALPASVLLTISWGFLVANHDDFICMSGFAVSAWAGSGILKSILQMHKSFNPNRRATVRILVMASTEASPIVFAIIGTIYRKHILSMKTLFTALGVFSFLTGCMLYVLVVGDTPDTNWGHCQELSDGTLLAVGAISNAQLVVLVEQQQQQHMRGAPHSAYPPPLGERTPPEHKNRMMNNNWSSPLSMRSQGRGGGGGEGGGGYYYPDCSAFSVVLPYTLRDPDVRQSVCVSTAPDGGVLMPTGIWEEVGGLELARSSVMFTGSHCVAWTHIGSFLALHRTITYPIMITVVVVVVTVAAHSVRTSNEVVWVWKHDQVPVLFVWMLPLLGLGLPFLGLHVSDRLAPSYLCNSITICALAYAFFASLDGPISSFATLLLALLINCAPRIITPIVLEQVFGSFRVHSLQESLYFRSATISVIISMVAVWVPALRSLGEEEEGSQHVPGGKGEVVSFGWWWRTNTASAEAAAAAAVFGLGSGIVGLFLAQLLTREENNKLKEQLDLLFRLVRVDLDGLVDYSEFWQVARMFSIEDMDIDNSWLRALKQQYYLDVPLSTTSPNNAGDYTLSLLPRSGSTQSNGEGSNTAFITANMVKWQGGAAANNDERGAFRDQMDGKGGGGGVLRSSRRRSLSSTNLRSNNNNNNNNDSKPTGHAAQAAQLGIAVLGRGMSSQMTDGDGEGEFQRVRLEYMRGVMSKETRGKAGGGGGRGARRYTHTNIHAYIGRRFERKLISAVRRLRKRQLHGESHFFDEMGTDQQQHMEYLSGRAFSPSESENSQAGHVPRSSTQWLPGDEDDDDSCYDQSTSYM